jgi:hypothetical protein
MSASVGPGFSRACPHEREVLDLVAIDQWPQRADGALRAHVEVCESCAEVASIAAAVREWGESAPVPRVSESSIVWHRAQLRAKAEAARAATRPLWVAQAFALAVLVAALIWIGPSATWYASVWQRLMPSAPASIPQATSALPAGWGWTVGLAVAGIAVFVSLILGAIRLSERLETSK